MKYTLLLILAGFLSNLSIAQEKITVEDIWRDYKFFGKSVAGFNFQKDGKHYTKLEDGKIVQYDFASGEETAVLFDIAEAKKLNSSLPDRIDGYTFSSDEQKILLKTNTEAIYRRSTKANFYVIEMGLGKTAVGVSALGKQMYATLSPDGSKVAYVIENDLYFKDLKSQEEYRVTRDGRKNQIINGSADWVYEEEFSFAKAFHWSPDGQKIAFMRFDESRVKEFTMTNYKDGVYPEYETFKYPKVGEDNAIVTLHIFDVPSKKTIKINTDYEKPGLAATEQIYFPRITWTQDANQLAITKMNRHQSELTLLLANATTGETSTLLNETNKYYIDVTDNLTFLKGGKEFIWTSEKSGFNHIYVYNMKGKEVRSLTSGNYDVTSFYGVDEAKGKVFYQAAKVSPLNREVYSVSIKGKEDARLTPEDGTNSAQFSNTFDYYVNTYSNANKAATYNVYDLSGKIVRSLEDNAGVATNQSNYGISQVEFIKVPSGDPSIQLNASIIKPANFDATKKYPVFMYVYGGPGSQTVQNSFGGANYWWFQMLAQEGYIVVSVDNRGTGARGEEFKKMTYLQLGKYETEDQIAAAKYLANQDYVDGDRIGIFGWSYGGYMSSLCITKGADVFKSAIAVAPVTNWKWYDTIYTERYMRTLKENEKGYEDNSPVNFADQLKGSYLLVHGMSDDNVHFQNAGEMARALIEANKQFDTYYYPNRNHGIYGGNTRLHLYTKMTDFIKETL